jgi:hypothetical protein
VKSHVLLLAAIAVLGAGCFPEDRGGGITVINPADLPPCTPASKAGDTFTLRLGALYDAESAYWWDGSIDPLGVNSEPHRTCAGVDGLQEGSVVTFKLGEMYLGFDTTCNPRRADFQPEAFHAPADGQIPQIIGVTIATSLGQGQINGRATTAIRGLFTPNMDPSGTLEPRKLPPLAVTRELTWQSGDDEDFCYDAWVATPEPAP